MFAVPSSGTEYPLSRFPVGITVEEPTRKQQVQLTKSIKVSPADLCSGTDAVETIPASHRLLNGGQGG